MSTARPGRPISLIERGEVFHHSWVKMPALVAMEGEDAGSAFLPSQLSHLDCQDSEENGIISPVTAFDLGITSLKSSGARRSLQELETSIRLVHSAASNRSSGIPQFPSLQFTAVSQRHNVYSPSSPVCNCSQSSGDDSSPEFLSSSSRVECTSCCSFSFQRGAEVAPGPSSVSVTETTTTTTTSISSGHVSRSPLRSILRTGSGLQRSKSEPSNRRKEADSAEVLTFTTKLRQQTTRSVVFGDERGFPLVSVFHYQCGLPLRRHRSAPGNIFNIGLPVLIPAAAGSGSLDDHDLSDDELAQALLVRPARSNAKRKVAEKGSGAQPSATALGAVAPIKYYLDGPQPCACLDFLSRLGANMVCLERVSVTAHGEIAGHVQVVNAAYQKSVKVRLTVDNWDNCVEVIAKYSNSLGDLVDRFTFTYRLPAIGLTCNRSLAQNAARASFIVAQFAVRFTMDGKEHWDNNYTKNYRIVRELKRS